jgi:hypothetical protein
VDVIVLARPVGVFRQRRVFLATADEARQLTTKLGWREIVKFMWSEKPTVDSGFFVRETMTQTSLIDLSSGLEAVYRRMDPKSCRYEIRRAERLKEQVTVERNSQRAIEDFFTLYSRFARTKNGLLPVLSRAMLGDYLRIGEVFATYLDGVPMCGHLLFCDREGSTVRLKHSASARQEGPETARACGALNRYLHWHEFQVYAGEGIRTYDFGGIRHKGDPVSDFKLSFGGRIVPQWCSAHFGLPQLGKLMYRLADREVFRRLWNFPGAGRPDTEQQTTVRGITG